MPDEATVIGIDPGLRVCGWGVITDGPRPRYVASGVIKPRTTDAIEQRLLTINRAIAALIAEHEVSELAVEDPFVGSINAASALAIGQARAAALLAAAAAGIEAQLYAPAAVKAAVSGYGQSDKGQVQTMVKLLLALDEPPEPADASDALAVALCHLQNRRMRASDIEGSAMTTSKARNAVAIPRAFILDCDGVLTDPVVKCVTRLDVFTALGERLDRGEVVTINTGRSIAWLIRNGIIDFVERAVHNKANLERFMVVCEKGASWVTFIGGVIRTNIDKSITVPEAVREDVYDLVQDHFLDCMFWDPTKLTMISVEMIDGMPMEAFQKRQAELVVELRAILDSPEHRPLELEIDASTIATDIQDRRAGKHLGARRIVEWLERRGLAPEHFVTIGDSQSDTAMAEELQDAHAVDFVYVGDPARFNAAALRCRVVQTNARFELGTLEYLESLP